MRCRENHAIVLYRQFDSWDLTVINISLTKKMIMISDFFVICLLLISDAWTKDPLAEYTPFFRRYPGYY